MSGSGAGLAADHRALRTTGAAVRLPRDLVTVTGPEATTFLQGQLSQDVAALAAGGSAWSLLLAPTGKVDAWLRVSRLDPDRYLLDVDPGWGEAVRARLDRFKLRTKADLEPTSAWPVVAVRAAVGVDVEALATDVVAALGVGADDAIVAPAPWPGLAGADVLAPASPGADLGLMEVGLDALEVARVECGVPAMGAELTEATIPAEAGAWLIAASVSFTKGCYTGQELVARIDARGGQVPRPLRGVVLGADAPGLRAGAEVRVGDDVVGVLTSVVRPPDRVGPIGLAPVARGVEPGTEGHVVWAGGSVPATVETLPLPRPI